MGLCVYKLLVDISSFSKKFPTFDFILKDGLHEEVNAFSDIFGYFVGFVRPHKSFHFLSKNRASKATNNRSPISVAGLSRLEAWFPEKTKTLHRCVNHKSCLQHTKGIPKRKVCVCELQTKNLSWCVSSPFKRCTVTSFGNTPERHTYTERKMRTSRLSWWMDKNNKAHHVSLDGRLRHKTHITAHSTSACKFWRVSFEGCVQKDAHHRRMRASYTYITPHSANQHRKNTRRKAKANIASHSKNVWKHHISPRQTHQNDSKHHASFDKCRPALHLTRRSESCRHHISYGGFLANQINILHAGVLAWKMKIRKTLAKV